MKAFGSSCVFALALCIGLASAEFCSVGVVNSCTHEGKPDDILNCNAYYSAAREVVPELNQYFLEHISYSFQYLLMSTNFANYEKNREGFSKLYKKLSDTTWEDAIGLIKYVTKRGGTMDLSKEKNIEPPLHIASAPKEGESFEMHELQSLGRALDMQKYLAEKAHLIHSQVSNRLKKYHDAETLSYLENTFVHKHADEVRNLAGYTADLGNLIKTSPDPSLAVFLFDEQLHKLL